MSLRLEREQNIKVLRKSWLHVVSGCKCPPYGISTDDTIGFHFFDHLERANHSHGRYPQELDLAEQVGPGPVEGP